MEQIIDNLDREILEYKEDLSQWKKRIFKKKLKLIVKSLLKLTLIGGGVTLVILFPSAMVIAIVGGVFALVDGSDGSIKYLKKTKNDNKERKKGKKELAEKEKENAANKKMLMREMINNTQHPPTAPPLYPTLN